MVVLGILFLLVGYLVGIGLLVTLGWVCLVVGLILLVLSGVGRPVGGRNWF